MGKLRLLTKNLIRNLYVQAALVGLATILPFLTYVVVTDSVIAPLNIVAGWDVSAAGDSVKAPIPSDVTQQMLPFREYTKEALATYHEIPLWNNLSFAGDVFLANPINTALSPLNALLYVTDIYTFQNIVVLLGIFLLSSCMYLLLRQLKLSILASCLGALAFSLAPFSVFWSIYGIVAIPMATIPLTLFFYLRWKEQSRLLNPFLLFIAASLGIAAYTGHVQIVLLPYIVLFLHVCYDFIFLKLGIKKALVVGGSMLLALLISTPQLLPMVVQTPNSHRSSETTTFASKSWSERLSELSNIPSSYNLASGPDDLGTTSRRQLLIGQIPGIFFVAGSLLVISIFARQRKAHWTLFYLGLFILGAFWQWNDFPQTLLNAVSSTFRSLATDYFLPIALLGMAVIAAYGFDWLIGRIFGKKRERINPIRFTVTLLPVIAVILISIPQLMLSKVDTLDNTYFTLYYTMIILAALFYIVSRNKAYAKLSFGILLASVTLLQGWALYRASQPIVPREVTVVKNPQLNFIAQQTKPDTIPGVVDFANPFESIYYDVSLINGYDSLYSSSILTRIKAINHPNKTPATYRNNALVLNNPNKPTLFKNLGVEYMLNQKPSGGYAEKYPGVYQADQSTPKIYFAKKIRSTSKEEQLAALEKGDVAYHEVAIEGSHRIAEPASKVNYRSTSNSLTIETQSPNGGLLFIAQTYNPDWQATIDAKKPLDILPAYYDFSAVDVPAGSHKIVLRYAPSSFTTGVIIATSSLVLLVSGTTYFNFRSKQKKS
jgi:hypothetical protein